MDKLNEFNSDFIEGLILPAVMFTIFLVLLVIAASFDLFVLRQLQLNIN